MIRRDVTDLVALGPLQPSKNIDMQLLEKQEGLITALKKPATDVEACVLVQIFGPDECYGLAWALVHFIESAPNWPIERCLQNEENEWVKTLRQRALNAGISLDDPSPTTQ